MLSVWSGVRGMQITFHLGFCLEEYIYEPLWPHLMNSSGVDRFLSPGVSNHNGLPTEIINFKKVKSIY
jgi:hypothetical protein